MELYIFSVVLAIASNVLYHMFQKSIPDAVNPASSLIVTYASALLGSIILWFIFTPRKYFLDSFKDVNWSSYALGLSIIGLEAGFLLAYRAGWNVSTAVLLVNASVTLLLIPIGLLMYKEHISPLNILGIVFSIVGILLMSKK
jgi:drug/metabolite transporter (DMT)-like permease